MNTELETLDDDTRFDRLVDGELSDDEYRDLVASLDDHPDGWRRCATAFLEAQAWGKECRTLMCDVETKSSIDRQKHSQSPSTLQMILAVAASFLVALGLGLYLRGWSPTGTATGESVAEKETPEPRQEALVPDHQEGKPAPNVAPPETNNEPNEPLGNIRLVFGDESVEVPVFELNDTNMERLADDSFPIPQDMLRRLEQMGHRLQRDQSFMPVELENGRRVVIPVDQFEIVPVSGNRFQ